MNTIRAYIAIEIPSSNRSQLIEAQEKLREKIPSKTIRWVPAKNIHLTLKFLGNTELDRLPSISNAIDLVAKHHIPFNLELSEIGCFPNARNPRVVWIGIYAETNELMAIQQGIVSSLLPLGWEPDGRKFHPHLTLGRVKDSRQLVAAQLPWGTQFARGGFMVDSITLFESQLQSSGARYIARHNSRLKG